jgi:hypothetical protein
MAGGIEGDGNAIDGDRLAVSDFLVRITASVPAVARTWLWPGRAWSAWAWEITARSTGRVGSMKNPPGSQNRPCGVGFSQVSGCGGRRNGKLSG